MHVNMVHVCLLRWQNVSYLSNFKSSQAQYICAVLVIHYSCLIQAASRVDEHPTSNENSTLLKSIKFRC